MPIPRRFDRRPPERDMTRINERIRVPQVRLIGENGDQIGIIKTEEALRYAQERDLDLVEIAADAKPPVCRVLDYSKYKYEQEQRRKAARKHQQQVTIREMKLRPKIATHDYETKKGHILRFLKQNFKVKVTIMFRGREQAHPERGEALLRKLAAEVSEFGTIEQEPNQEGRNMTMMMAPVRGASNNRRPERTEERPADSAADASGSPPPAEGDGAPAQPEQPEPAQQSQPPEQSQQPQQSQQPEQSPASVAAKPSGADSARAPGAAG